jgi:hypothetical protein
VADAGRDHVRAVRVRFADRVAGDDPDRHAIGLGRAAAGRLHHPRQPAADERHARPGKPSTHLLGEQGSLGLGLAIRPSDHRHLPPPAHRGPDSFIERISSSAPSLCSGSLRLPHLGLCTQEGQPDSQGHSAISRSASPSSRSNCS